MVSLGQLLQEQETRRAQSKAGLARGAGISEELRIESERKAREIVTGKRVSLIFPQLFM